MLCLTVLTQFIQHLLMMRLKRGQVPLIGLHHPDGVGEDFHVVLEVAFFLDRKVTPPLGAVLAPPQQNQIAQAMRPNLTRFLAEIPAPLTVGRGCLRQNVL